MSEKAKDVAFLIVSMAILVGVMVAVFVFYPHRGGAVHQPKYLHPMPSKLWLKVPNPNYKGE